jgi:superfamily II DNA/RNA helicase
MTTTAGTITNENNMNEIMDSDARQALPKEFSKWEDLDDFDSDLLRGIYAHGFDKPSIIQQKSIKKRYDCTSSIGNRKNGSI